MEAPRKTHVGDNDLRSSNDEESRRKLQLPKADWAAKAASLSKLQQQRHHLIFTKQHKTKAPASPQQLSMKESILKDLRIALNESNDSFALQMTQSVLKQQQQSQTRAAIATKRVTSVPKLFSNDPHNKKKKRKLPANKNSNQWTGVVSWSAWGSDHDDSSQDDDDANDDGRQINAGVYQLENTKTGHCYFGTTWDLKNAAAQSFSDLANSTHPHMALTKCFQLYGAKASGIRYRVLERVAAPPPSKVSNANAPSKSTRRPSDKQQQTRGGGDDAFDVKKMELLLQKRLNFHTKKHLLRRTLQLVRRLVVLPFLHHYWPRWTHFTVDQQTLEREAAVTELQRVCRGRLGRKFALTRRKLRAAVQLQRFLRLCVAKCVLERRKRNRLEHVSATTIQRGVRGFLENRMIHNRRLVVRKWLQARKIQALYRGHRGRCVAAQLILSRAQHMACTLIQKTVRGLLGRRATQRRREDLIHCKAAVCIQKRWRGALARNAFIIRKCATSEYQRRHEAALKIQSVYGLFLERKLCHVASEYSFQTQQATAIRMAYKNYVAKKFGWAAMTFALETSMATRIQRGAQRWFFFLRVRQLVIAERRERAARAIQRVARGKLGRRQFQILQHLQRQVSAAKRIQLAWTSHQFLEKLRRTVYQWRREKSACRIQATYRSYHARQLYLVVRTRARREQAAVTLQSMYRSRHARREWRRRLELRQRGACGDCGDQLASLYSFSLEIELCAQCWERVKQQGLLEHVHPIETLDVTTYRRLKTQLVVAQRAYRKYQLRLAKAFGLCSFCEHKAVRKHCDACGSAKRFCHSCSALFHRLKKDETSSLHVSISIEHFGVRERAAIVIQKHFRRFQQRRTLLHLRRNMENVAAVRIQRMCGSHRQRRITRALFAAQRQRQMDELRAALAIQAQYRGHIARQVRQQLALERRSAICIQRAARGRKSRLIAQGLRQCRDAAITIQRHFRGMRDRHLVAVKKHELQQTKQRRAAICIQRRARGVLARQLKREVTRQTAALVIQQAWRSWTAKCELKRRIRARDERQRELEYAIQQAKAAQKADSERKAATRIQTWTRQRLAICELHERQLARAREYREKRREQALALEFASAVCIQRMARSKWLTTTSRRRLAVHCRARQFLSRRVLQQLRVEKRAVLMIQRAFRHSRVRRALETLATGAAELSLWVELYDEASGSVYYYNTETMESSWEKPDDEQQEEEPEWLECWDENAGASYFYNTKTGEATWTTPEEMDAEAYYAPEAADGNNNQSLDAGLYAGGPEMGSGVVFRTLPPKTKAAMSKRSVLDNNSNQVPEAMFRTAPAVRSTLNAAVIPEAYPDSGWGDNQDTNAVDPQLYEYAYDESVVETEYDINYKIFMTQLERDGQQQQQQEDDEVHEDEPDDQQERQQQ